MADETRASPAQESVDGRTARRDRNKEAVLDAMIALIEEGTPAPTVAKISERSDVSHRSVYRYFDDLSDLYASAASRAFERYAPLSRIHAYRSGSLSERIEAFIDQRVALFSAFAPLARAAQSRPEALSMVSTTLDAYLAPLVDQVAEQFAPEFGALPDNVREARLKALAVLTSFDAHDYMVRTGNDDRAVRAAFEAGIRALLA